MALVFQHLAVCLLHDVHVSISPKLIHIRVIGKCEAFKIVCLKCGVIGEWENMGPRICRSNFQAALFISFITCGQIELSAPHRSPCPGKSGMPLSCKNFFAQVEDGAESHVFAAEVTGAASILSLLSLLSPGFTSKHIDHQYSFFHHLNS